MLRPALALLLALPLGAAELAVLAPEHPRAFFFRSCEGFARAGRVSYERWDEEYSRLHGIIGKCLDEEIPGTMTNNPAWFTRFKQDHPEQVVLLHFNGNANDPLFEGEHYFPGHWIHRAATPITRDIPAAAGETVIHVENSRDFKTGTGRYRNINDDIALFGVTADGKHQWSHCEQVQLLAVDHEAGTIRVRRGCYGTRPLAFTAGQSRAAAHAVEGPWGKNNHLLWFYNFTDHCPRDSCGKTAADVLVDRFAAWFGAEGPLGTLDGVEFDVMHHLTHGDTTGDGRPDDGIIDGRNRYGTGVVGFARKLRRRMGPGFIIQGDGALGEGGLRSQRAFQILNGMQPGKNIRGDVRTRILNDGILVSPTPGNDPGFLRFTIPDLRFSIGMAPLAPERSDGVDFQVHVAELSDGKPGKFEQVFHHNTNQHQWLDQSIDLTRWTGKHVRLKFVSDCGPKNNPNRRTHALVVPPSGGRENLRFDLSLLATNRTSPPPAEAGTTNPRHRSA